MDGFVIEFGQPGHIAANKLAFWVKLFALVGGVEDAEVGLRIAAARAGPLPAAVVGGKVKVVQVLGKIALAPAPIEPQVFGQKTGHHHAQAVVHVASLVDLRHGRIHQRIARAALAPRGKQFFGLLVMVPFDVVVFGLERTRHHTRMVMQDLVIKIAPNQLRQPHLSTGRAHPHAFKRGGCQLANRHCAEAQMHAQVAGAFDGGKVAGFVVTVHAVKEVFKQSQAAGAARGHMQAAEVGGFKANVCQARHSQLVGWGPSREGFDVFTHGVRL